MANVIKTLMLILGILSSGSFAFSQKEKLSLEGAIQSLWMNNPQLNEFDKQIEYADKDKMRRFIPNSPELSVGKSRVDRSLSLGISIDFAFPGTAYVLSKLDDANARKQRLEKSAKRYELAALVTDAYVDCASVSEKYIIQKKTFNEWEVFLQSVKVRRGVTPAEKLSFELETRQARQVLIELSDLKDVQCAQLKKLISYSDNGASSLELPKDIPADFIESIGTLTAEENLVKSTIDVAQVQFDTARWTQMPEMSFGFSSTRLPDQYSSQNVGDIGWYNGFEFSISLPIFYPFDESIEVKKIRSQSVIQKSQAEIEYVRLLAQRRESAKDFKRSQRFLKELYDKNLPLGQSLVETTYSAYRAGQLGYIEMIMSRRTLIDLKLREIELKSQILKARIKCLDKCESDFSELEGVI